MRYLILLALVACGGGTDPRVIPGGGVGDGDIDGKVFVHVIDGVDDAPLANAMVAIGAQEKVTDAKGFVEFEDVDGPQSIAVKLQGYRSQVWARVNGKNVTIPMNRNPSTVPQATLSGGITAWDTITLMPGHIKAALVLYSHNDDLGDQANSLDTPGMMNICTGTASCNWTVVTRTGTVSLLAAIVDRDTKGTPLDPDDDTQVIIGWATKSAIAVAANVTQSGIMLAQVEAGNLENLSVDFGAPPAALDQRFAFIGIEVSDDEVVQLPFASNVTTNNMLLAPKPSVFGGTKGLRLSAIAGTTSGEAGAQSIVLRRNLSGPTLAAGTWLTPPVGVSATRATATWERVAGAKLHQVQYTDAQGNDLLEITVFDEAATTTEVPPFVALPALGVIRASVGGIGADLDPQDFSLEEDEDKLFGIASQPTTVN